MHISPRPSEFGFEAQPSMARKRPWLSPLLAYVVISLAAAGGAAVLAQRGVTAPLPCGEDFAAVCAAP